MRRTPNWLILALVGDVLAVVGLFGPWLRLYTAFGNLAGERGYGVWTLFYQGDDWDWYLALGVFVLVTIMVVSSLTSLLIYTRRALAKFFAYPALLLAILCFTLALFFLFTVPLNLPLVWPYFDIRAIDFGAWAALMGFVCIAIGALGVIGSLDREESEWETAGG